jgi:hypothetical protein
MRLWEGTRSAVSLRRPNNMSNARSCSVCAQIGWTPIMTAARDGHLNVVRLLVAYKAQDVNEGNASSKRTALWHAAAQGHEEVVRVLVCEGFADVTLCDREGKAPIQVAWERGHYNIAEFLEVRTHTTYHIHHTSTPLLHTHSRTFHLAVWTQPSHVLVSLFPCGCSGAHWSEPPVRVPDASLPPLPAARACLSCTPTRHRKGTAWWRERESFKGRCHNGDTEGRGEGSRRAGGPRRVRYAVEGHQRREGVMWSSGLYMETPRRWT